MHLAHLFTAGAYLLIGGLLLMVSMLVWNTPSWNRPFLFGSSRLLTPEGAVQMMRLWPFVFLFGLFILACAVDHIADWFAMHGLISYAWVDLFGIIEAAVSWLTALSMAFQIGQRLRRNRWTHR